MTANEPRPTADTIQPTRDVRDGTPIDVGKLRTLAVGSRTRDVIREGRRKDGVRWKSTTDELGNTVTQHAQNDRQDVHINAPFIGASVKVREER